MLIFALSELREERNVLRNTQVLSSFYTTTEVKRTASHKRIASQKHKRVRNRSHEDDKNAVGWG
jgi:hypothetical protein